MTQADQPFADTGARNAAVATPIARHTNGLAPRPQPRKKKVPGGQHNPLKRLNSAKEIQGKQTQFSLIFFA
jgi:hypothetical protein